MDFALSLLLIFIRPEVLPTVMRRVRPRNLVTEETLAHWRLSLQQKILLLYVTNC
jgi:hypothetical protein